MTFYQFYQLRACGVQIFQGGTCNQWRMIRIEKGPRFSDFFVTFKVGPWRSLVIILVPILRCVIRNILFLYFLYLKHFLSIPTYFWKFEMPFTTRIDHFWFLCPNSSLFGDFGSFPSFGKEFPTGIKFQFTFSVMPYY